MSFNRRGDISTLNGTTLKLVDKFTYLGSSVSSTENDINTRPAKAWTANDNLSVIWKSDLTDKIKRSFSKQRSCQYGHTTWTLTKHMGTKTLTAITQECCEQFWYKPYRQHPTNQLLYGHLTPITKTIKVKRTRHAGNSYRSKDELISDTLQWNSSHGWAKDSQLEPIYNNSVSIQDITLKTSQERWTIEMGGEREREREGNPCWQRDMMMMMMITIYYKWFY